MLEKYPKESVEKKETIGAVGFSEDQGTRDTMEDAHVVERGFMGDPQKSFFAVYDGHHGRQAADFAAKNLHEYLKLSLEGGTDQESALNSAFVMTDKKIEEEFSGEEYQDAGAAALTVLVDGRRAWVANAGDVRAVLVKESSEERLSRDHHADDPDARQKVIDAGGDFYQHAKLRMPDGTTQETYHWDKPEVKREFSLRGAKLVGKDAVRIYRRDIKDAGGLNMSRSLGDAWAKGAMNPEPEVKLIEIQPEDRKLIIACDGVWNVITDTMAAEIVRGKTAQEAAEAIIKEINSRRKEKNLAQDNTTVLVIDLNEQGGSA